MLHNGQRLLEEVSSFGRNTGPTRGQIRSWPSAAPAHKLTSFIVTMSQQLNLKTVEFDSRFPNQVCMIVQYD